MDKTYFVYIIASKCNGTFICRNNK